MKVLVPGALRSYTGELHVQADGDTLAAMFADLDRQYPGLRFRVVDEQGQLRPNMRVFVNGLAVRDLGHALRPDDFENQERAKDFSDLGLVLLVNQVLVDNLFVTWWSRKNPKVAWQLSVIDAEALAFAIAVNELECWLLPLVYDNKKAAKTVGCFEALTQGLKEQKEPGLLQRDGNSKAPRRYQDVAAPLRKPKVLANAVAHSPSLQAFVDRLSALTTIHRLTPPPIAPQ